VRKKGISVADVNGVGLKISFKKVFEKIVNQKYATLFLSSMPLKNLKKN
jgi:hypothetical protein